MNLSLAETMLAELPKPTVDGSRCSLRGTRPGSACSWRKQAVLPITTPSIPDFGRVPSKPDVGNWGTQRDFRTGSNHQKMNGLLLNSRENNSKGLAATHRIQSTSTLAGRNGFELEDLRRFHDMKPLCLAQAQIFEPLLTRR